jgi:hypothetical protein
MLIVFTIQAAIETLHWPGGVVSSEFMTRESGVTFGGYSNRKRNATPYELWPSSSLTTAHFSATRVLTSLQAPKTSIINFEKIGLQTHIGRGATAPKTETIYFPPPRQAYAAADTPRFLVEGTGFVELSEKFKYLGSVIHCPLTSDAGV